MGQLVATPGVLALGVDFRPLLGRHLRGDWGDCSQDDREANDRDIHGGGRLFSAYETPKGRVWIITEADRSSTCVLLPEDY